jgi:hypothetical protein
MSNVIQLPVIAGVEITTDEKGRFNLNALHKASKTGPSKKPSEWMRNAQTKELADKLSGKSRLGQNVINTIKGGSAPGTFAVKQLAVAYAAWVDADFHLEVLDVFIESKEQKSQAPLSVEEIIYAQSGALLEHKQQMEQQGRQLRVLESGQNEMAQKVSQIERITQNGVPVGYIAKSKAHKKYSQGLSKEVFEQALTVLNVKTEQYVHTENDHSVYTFAWKESEIKSAVGYFIENSIQTSPQTCSSKILNGKKFRFMKEKSA